MITQATGEHAQVGRTGQTPGRILIADDQPDVLEALRLLLKAEGYEIETVASPAGILAAIDDLSVDVLLI